MFFFFAELYDVPQVHIAFDRICTQKMLSDGYFDLSFYTNRRMTKDEFYYRLKTAKSKYAALYEKSKSYPSADNAVSVWDETIGIDAVLDPLTYFESVAIVNWVYCIFRTAEEKRQFTIDLMSRIKELSSIAHNIRISNGVAYNDDKVELHFLSSVGKVNDFISELDRNERTIFYRGHSDPNYFLRPSVMRTEELLTNESNMYHELLIECPDDFQDCSTHFQKLVKMQHYGLPTRLLDITKNPLVALYFACAHNLDAFGELVLISIKTSEIKYPQDDAVTLLSSIPALSNENRNAISEKITTGHSNPLTNWASSLENEVRLEKPTFFVTGDGRVLSNSYVVYAEKSNQRIIKQDGAFILCGLNSERTSLEKFRYYENGKKVVVIIKNKKAIMSQLEAFSINRATLFPEIECVSEYISRKYAKG